MLLYICRIFSEDHVTTIVQVCVFIEVGVARLLDVLLYFTELGVTLYRARCDTLLSDLGVTLYY